MYFNKTKFHFSISIYKFPAFFVYNGLLKFAQMLLMGLQVIKRTKYTNQSTFI